MGFCAAITCMDGRIQLPVIHFLQQRFGVAYVDMITAAGPNRLLAEAPDGPVVQEILDRLQLSMQRHHAVGVAVVGHHDCAGNPVTQEQQIQHLHEALQVVQRHVGNLPVIRLWVNDHWQVEELSSS